MIFFHQALGGGFLYADDTVIFRVGENDSELETGMNSDLAKLEECCCLNRLSINSKNTKYVLLDRPKGKNLNLDLSLRICGDLLMRTSSYIYLGVTLDNSLTFNSHID